MAITYSLTAVNNSANIGSVCVYQTDPGFNVMGPAFSIAWLASTAAPSTTVSFSWQQGYGFACANTGQLVPGLSFETSQIVPADLTSGNQITLSGQQDGELQLTNLRQGPRAGILFVHQDGSVPPYAGAIAFCVSGQPAFAVQASPNINIVYTPQPKYWLIFGTFQEGEVIDTALLGATAQGSFTQPIRVQFPPNVYSLQATLDAQNQWTIAPAD